MEKVMSKGTKVEITDAMDTSWIGKQAVITEVILVSPLSYKLDIGGGHWLSDCLKKIS
jgi:hypothetical protein